MKKILIVDDKESIRTLIEDELEDEGYEVLSESSGKEALATLDNIEYQVDLVMLDIKMPGMNGLEVLNEIKKKNKNLPVILLSAYHTYKQDFSSWAADDYIVKSTDFAELKSKIENLIG